jgi:hypothetical protein
VLKDWVKSAYVPPGQERKTLQNQLGSLKCEMETEEVLKQNILEERELYSKIHRSYHKEEEEWRLKSRSL